MKYLEEKIKKNGQILPGDILKVDSFLNHQIEVEAVDEIGKEFARLFSDIKPNKILTIEASGIAMAYSTAKHMSNQLIVFAKKNRAANMSGNVYEAKERSYTRGVEYTIQVSKEYLNENDKVLIIDDFLANGEAMNALIEICKQAKAEVLAVGAVIGKMYQPGYERIKKLCPRVEVLAKVKSMDDNGGIEFCVD